MSKVIGEIDGRTVTVTYLGTMSNEEATDIMAECVAKIIYRRKKAEEEAHKDEK